VGWASKLAGVVLAAGLVSMGCTSSDTEPDKAAAADEPSSQPDESSATQASSNDTSATSPSGPRENPKLIGALAQLLNEAVGADQRARQTELKELYDLLDDTVAAPRMSFTLDTEMLLPGSSALTVVSDSGSFDDHTFTGIGTGTFTTELEDFRDASYDQPYEFVLVDDIWWFSDPSVDPTGWMGVDIFEYMNAGQFDPFKSMDGDSYLDDILRRATGLTEVTDNPDGSTTWTVQVSADELAYVFITVAPFELVDLTFTMDSNIITEVTVEEHRDGYISAMSGDLDEWLDHALSTLGGYDDLVGESTFSFELGMEPFDTPITTEPPCTDPAPTVIDGFDLFVCGGISL